VEKRLGRSAKHDFPSYIFIEVEQSLEVILEFLFFKIEYFIHSFVLEADHRTHN